jgi:hypothetical protein
MEHEYYPPSGIPFSQSTMRALAENASEFDDYQEYTITSEDLQMLARIFKGALKPKMKDSHGKAAA